MSLVKWAFIAVLLLPVAEVATFVLIALLIGWFWAVCLLLATTALGILALRRSGRHDIDRFRAAFAQDGIRAIHLESPGFGPMLGGILLVFPGFITDVLGAMLLVPAFRRYFSRAIRRANDARRRQRDPSLVDLTPKEWHQVSERPPSDPPLEDSTPRKRVRGK
jgi:UPF0716 protein FxsA